MLEPKGTTPPTPTVMEAPQLEKPAPIVPVKEKRNIPVLALIAVLIGLGAVGYAYVLQTKLAQLSLKVAANNAAVGEVQQAITVANQKIVETGKTFSDKIEALDGRVSNKFKTLDDIQKDVAVQLRQIPDMQSRFTADIKSLLDQNTELSKNTQLTQTNQDSDEKKIATLVLIVKNQDKVLRQILPKQEEPVKQTVK